MTNRGAILSRVIQSAARTGRTTSTDQELLRRFAVDGDQSAFEVLVRRHTGLVLGACRRALTNTQDAEDACQATFLILARKAGSGRWQASIANWLFTTARRVSRDVRRATIQRQRREGKVAVPELVQPVDRMTGREMLAVIDEELDRLPVNYREPLLLFYQEELSRAEIARRLGVPAGTVKIRLERGRKKLGGALSRRGVAMSAGLLGLVTSARVGATPRRLVESVLAMLDGKPSPNVASLTNGVAAHGLFTKSILGALTLAATITIGIGLGEPRTTSAGPQPEKAMPAKKTAKAEAASDKPKPDVMRTVTGTVVDADGKPVAGAEMIHFPMGGKPTVVAKTDAAGKFSVAVAIKEPGAWLFPRVPGFGPGDFLMPATNTPAEKTFRLVKDVPIKGRIIDTQGKPVAGAAVVVRSISGFEEASLDRYLKAWATRESSNPGPSPRGTVHWTASGGALPLERKLPDGSALLAGTTDKDGRFVIAGIGGERLVNLHIEGTGIATTSAHVICRDGFDATAANRLSVERRNPDNDPDHGLGRNHLLAGPTPELIAEIEKPIRGTVTDVVTGKPIAGLAVRVRPHWSLRSPEWLPDGVATTDSAGRFAVSGVRKIAKYEVRIARDVERGYVGRSILIDDTVAYEPIDAKITIAKGIVVTGRILDQTANKTITGFVCAGVLFDNEFAKQPEFSETDTYDFAYTGKDGYFKTVVPPGPVLLMGGTHEGGNKAATKFEMLRPDPEFPQYFAKDITGFRSPDNVTTAMQGQYCKVINLKPDQKELNFDIPLKQPSQFRVNVRGQDGKPISGAMIAGNSSRDWMYPVPCDGDQGIIYEIERATPRLVVFFDPKTNQMGTLNLTGKEREPATVTLGPSGKMKCRLVNQAGEPLAGIRVTISYFDRPADEIDRLARGTRREDGKSIQTDDRGQFEVDGVVPGMKFLIYGRRGNRYLEPPERSREKAFEVQTGETKDLGKIVLKGE